MAGLPMRQAKTVSHTRKAGERMATSYRRPLVRRVMVVTLQPQARVVVLAQLAVTLREPVTEGMLKQSVRYGLVPQPWPAAVTQLQATAEQPRPQGAQARSQKAATPMVPGMAVLRKRRRRQVLTLPHEVAIPIQAMVARRLQQEIRARLHTEAKRSAPGTVVTPLRLVRQAPPVRRPVNPTAAMAVSQTRMGFRARSHTAAEQSIRAMAAVPSRSRRQALRKLAAAIPPGAAMAVTPMPTVALPAVIRTGRHSHWAGLLMRAMAGAPRRLLPVSPKQERATRFRIRMSVRRAARPLPSPSMIGPKPKAETATTHNKRAQRQISATRLQEEALASASLPRTEVPPTRLR